MEIFLAGIGLGIATLPLCLPACLPVLLGLLGLRGDASWRGSAGAVGQFLAGRLAGYLLFGAVVGYVGAVATAPPAGLETRRAIALAYSLLGLALLLAAAGQHLRHSRLCAWAARLASWPGAPALAGLVTGLSACPPFLAAATYALDLGEVGRAILLFTGFFSGTSLGMIPLAFVGGARAGRVLRSLGSVACGLAGMMLLVAGVRGLLPRREEPVRESPAMYGRVLPGATEFTRAAGALPYVLGFRPHSKRGARELVGYAFITAEVVPEVRGYGGPVPVMVGLDVRGRILAVELLPNNETPGFRELVRDSDLCQRLVGKSWDDPLTIGVDVDAVSGATITSRAVVDGVRLGARRVAQAVRRQTGVELTALPAVGGALLYPLPLFFILAILGERRGWRRFRYVVLAASAVYLGFVAAKYVSVVNLVAIFEHRPPAPLGETLLVIVPALALSLFLGRVYCGWLCPFGAVSEILGHLAPWHLKVSEKVDRKLRALKYVLLVISPFLFIAGGAAALAFEPFGDLFALRLRGAGTMRLTWLVFLLMASLVCVRFYCKYLCAAGAAMAFVARFRLLPRRAPEGCRTCARCDLNCWYAPGTAAGAVRVSDAECLSCAECDLCPRHEAPGAGHAASG